MNWGRSAAAAVSRSVEGPRILRPARSLHRMLARWIAAAALGTAIVAAGCIGPARPPLGTGGGGGEGLARIGRAGMTPEEIQSELMSFVDRFWAVVAQAVDTLRQDTDSPQRRLGALSFKIVAVEGALRIATDANPLVGLLDMTVFVTLTEEVWNSHWGPKVYGEAPGGPVGSALEVVRTEIWNLTERVLDPEQVKALQKLIQDMKEQYPNQVYVVNLRASEFASERQRTLAREPGGASLLALFALDPLASLSPATREVQQSRLLAERAFFFFARLPAIISWRTDRALLYAAATPEAGQLFETLPVVRSSSEKLGDLAAAMTPQFQGGRVAAIDQLAERIAEERDAAIAQLGQAVAKERTAAIDELFGRVTQEREAFFGQLERDSGELSGLLQEVNATAKTTTMLSDSARQTVAEARELVATIAAMNDDGSEGRPFDIREYDAAAQSATRAVQEVSGALASLNRLLESPAWSERTGEARAALAEFEQAGQAVVDRAFRLAMILMLSTVGCVFLAALAYRAIAVRLGR